MQMYFGVSWSAATTAIRATIHDHALVSGEMTDDIEKEKDGAPT